MKCKILILIFGLCSFRSSGQNIQQAQIATIRSFVKSVFSSTEIFAAQKFSSKYMDFNDNSVELNQKRYELLTNHIKMIKEQKQKLYDENDIKIEPYSDLSPDLQLNFDRSILSNTYGVLSKGKLLLYINLKKNKIVSFDYIKKDTNIYFITY